MLSPGGKSKGPSWGGGVSEVGLERAGGGMRGAARGGGCRRGGTGRGGGRDAGDEQETAFGAGGLRARVQYRPLWRESSQCVVGRRLNGARGQILKGGR